MAGTVHLPVIGTVKTTWVIAGVGATVVILGVAYARHRSAGSAAAAPDDSSAAAAAAIDPETGLPEGSAGDQAALSALDDGAAAGLGGDTGGAAYGEPFLPGTVAASAASNTGPGTFTDNAYWLQYAEQNVTGYSVSQIQGALSAYLAGAKLTATQYTIYQVAIGVAGQPPSPPAHPAKPAPGPAKKKYKSFIAAGTTSLDQAAKRRGTTADQVVKDTLDANGGKYAGNTEAYVRRGNFTAKLPKGSKWYYT